MKAKIIIIVLILSLILTSCGQAGDSKSGSAVTFTDDLERTVTVDNPKRVVPTTIEIVDIAGLVKGASKGEGLGNKFLANIRECDAILHVVRCFENDDIIHVQEGGNKSAPIAPVDDAEVIETELILADMEQLRKRIFTVMQRHDELPEMSVPLTILMKRLARCSPRCCTNATG